MTFSEVDWQALKDEMRSILIDAARQCQTITYSELAASIRLAHIHHRAPYFHKLLRDMDNDETDIGRPSLAALVVRKDSGIPGSGFYGDAPVEEGKTLDHEAYWRKQFQQVCDYWGEK